eukprot:CAMPEP_0197258254 /NCGR_PEP_ID=MMETSP1429-20130617/81478_1 /TAXON_ID=49237 /ORGANISM="Chaetoceros  sp., Strain UNC1202" /LENGTH=179 /DNA_ID=CAMNT_0042722309 /DNA_START=55 /DNA_END=591 /DNA_ORIENTATION=-
MGNELSSTLKRRSKKKGKSSSPQNTNDLLPTQTTAKAGNTGNCMPKTKREDTLDLSFDKRPRPSIPQTETSAESFGRPATPAQRPCKEPERDPVMITDILTDVKDRYHINPKELGHGHYGVVRKCMDRKTKEWYAIKSIRKSKVNKVDVLKREIDILKEVNHPNIIRLIEVHEDKKYLH